MEIPQQGEQMGKGEAAQGSGASSPVTASAPSSQAQAAQGAEGMEGGVSQPVEIPQQGEQMGKGNLGLLKETRESVLVSEKTPLLAVDMPKADAASEKESSKGFEAPSSAPQHSPQQAPKKEPRERKKASSNEADEAPEAEQAKPKLSFSVQREGKGGGGQASDSPKLGTRRPSQDSMSLEEKQGRRWPWGDKKPRTPKRDGSSEEGAQTELKGSLEIKRPEKKESPFFVLSYDFTKIPDAAEFNKKKQEIGYAYQKYRPMLVKAQEFTRRKMIQNALNYYEVIVAQDIPEELKRMINKNISDISSYLKASLYR